MAGQPEDDVKKKAVARTPRQRILLGLNRFIGDVFNEGQSFGAILCGAGLADAAVRHLGKDTKARNRFNRALVCELKDWLPAAVGKPSYHVLARLYGLDGKAPDAPAALAQSMRRDEKDVRNLVDAALFTLQFEDRRRELTALVVRAALAALA